MNITVRGEVRYIPVSTITLQKDEQTHPFHCTNCGNTTNIIGGKVTRIYPILEPSDQITVISTCRSCKAKYVFQEGSEVATDPIHVLLNPKVETQSFFCYLGGGDIKALNKLVDYDMKHVYSYHSNSYVDLPYTTVCTNPECTIVHEFTQFL